MEIAERPLEVSKPKRLPERFKGLTCYQMNVRAFTPQGTLYAAREKLRFLQRTGVGIVYLCPIFTADDDTREEFYSRRQKASGLHNPQNPYRIKDYFTVDPEYGDIDDLTAFIEEAHGLGLFVLLDLVYYHCGPTARLVTDFPNFVPHDENGEWINGAYSFPALNFKNVALRAYLISNMRYLYSLGADGFRLDCADCVPADFWIQAKNELGETYDNSLIVYEGGQPPCDTMDFMYMFHEYPALYAVLNRDVPASEFRRAIESCPHNTLLLRYIDNHDIMTDGVKARSGDEESETVRINQYFSDDRMMAAHALLETIDGMPMIYCGDEIGSKAPHSLFANRFYGDMHTDWSAAETSQGKAHVAWLKALCDLRKRSPLLYDGKIRPVETAEKDKIVCFDRYFDADDAFIRVAVNVSEETVFLPFVCGGEEKKGEVTLLSRLVSEKKSGYELSSCGVLILRVEGSAK